MIWEVPTNLYGNNVMDSVKSFQNMDVDFYKKLSLIMESTG